MRIVRLQLFNSPEMNVGEVGRSCVRGGKVRGGDVG